MAKDHEEKVTFDVYKERFSLNQLEVITNVNHRTLKKRLMSLDPIGTGKGRKGHLYTLREALPLIFAPPEKGELILAEERAKLAAAQTKKTDLEAEKIRMDIDRMNETLVDVVQWEEKYTKLLVAFKDRLRGMASKLAAQVSASPEHETRNYRLIQAVVDEALEELSRGMDPTEAETEA